MEVLYSRCRGIDVHERFVVVCLREARTGTPHQRVATLWNDDWRFTAVTEVAPGGRLYARSDGKHRNVLASGLRPTVRARGRWW
jgi:hypothetical protein